MLSPRRLIFTGAMFGYAALITQMLVQVLVLPLIVKHLGKGTVGAYSFVLQLFGFVTILELGFAVSLGQSLTQAEASGNPTAISLTQKAGFLGGAFFGALYLLVLGGLALLVEHLPFMMEFRHENLQASFLALGVSSFIKTLFQVQSQSLVSRNQQWAFHLGTLIGTVVRAGLFLFVIFSGFGVVALIISYAISDVITVAFHGFMVFKQGRHRVAVPKPEVIAKLRAIAKFGRSLAPMQVASRLTYSSDSIIVGLLAGPAHVASFYSTQMPSFLVFQSLFILSDSSLPYITHLHAAGKSEDFEKHCRFLLKLSLGLGICLLFGILLFNRDLIYHWMGDELYAGSTMTAFLAIFCALQVIFHPFILFLVATANMQGWGSVALVGALLKVALSFVFGRIFGPAGVMGATTMIEIPLCIILIQRNEKIFHRLLSPEFKRYTVKVSIHFAVVALSSILLSAFSQPRDLFLLTLHILCYLSLNVVSLYFLVLTKEEQASIQSRMWPGKERQGCNR